MLHGILKPTRKEPSKGKRGPKKFGIEDSIEGMLKTRINISATVPKKKIEQPHILCIGDSVFSLREFFVIIEETTYKTTSFLQALEIAHKAFNLFNFKYPLESYNVWIFIQKYFFDIHFQEHDHINSDVSALLATLNYE